VNINFSFRDDARLLLTALAWLALLGVTARGLYVSIRGQHVVRRGYRAFMRQEFYFSYLSLEKPFLDDMIRTFPSSVTFLLTEELDCRSEPTLFIQALAERDGRKLLLLLWYRICTDKDGNPLAISTLQRRLVDLGTVRVTPQGEGALVSYVGSAFLSEEAVVALVRAAELPSDSLRPQVAEIPPAGLRSPIGLPAALAFWSNGAIQVSPSAQSPNHEKPSSADRP
jgi:hypothetical protein